MQYTIHKTTVKPDLCGDWNGPVWSAADTLEVAHFHPAGSNHRPRTEARLLYDNDGLFVIFSVEDRYVRCVRTEYQSPVCRDSCVEFFVQPIPDKGYFNVEFNCGGAMLLRYVTDPSRVDGKVAGAEPMDADLLDTVRVFHSLPATVDPEIATPVEWRIEYFVPFGVFERHVGALGDVAGQVWRGNLYKCGDETSHPHWASWSPIGERLDFHQPDRFGEILLGE